ncbi:MAG: TolB family protein [Bacteroidia bacterium]
MKFLVLIANCLLLTANCFSQLPDCDIWLMDIKDSAGIISFHNPVNITNRKGYDNQPAFSPDGKYILYSSQRDSTRQTHIYKYDIITKKTTQFTKTSTSEYSPAFTPNGENISIVMVEKDSTQRLWKFPISGTNPSSIMENVKEIGYYCWISKDSVAIHALTKPAFTLQVADVRSQKTIVIADSIGRCIRMKNGALWYTKNAGHFHKLFEYNFRSKTSSLKGVIESEDYCFYKNETWSCSDNTIVTGYMNSRMGAVELANFESYGITKISRITISADGKKLAVVSNK